MPHHEQESGQSLFPPASQETYQQPMLTGLETEQPEEVTLENCLVTSRPTYTRHGKTYFWQCSLSALPDIFHPDRDELVEVHTTSYAEVAHKKRLRPGDRISVTGILQQEELELTNGEKKTVNYLVVSDLHILSRAQRIQMTIFEQQRGR